MKLSDVHQTCYVPTYEADSQLGPLFHRFWADASGAAAVQQLDDVFKLSCCRSFGCLGVWVSAGVGHQGETVLPPSGSATQSRRGFKPATLLVGFKRVK